MIVKNFDYKNSTKPYEKTRMHFAKIINNRPISLKIYTVGYFDAHITSQPIFYPSIS